MNLDEAIESLKVKDYKQALDLFKDAAAGGNPDACDFIVQMYIMALEPSITSDDYLQYSIKGYEYRSKDGCFNLGSIYRNGMLGDPDLNKAYEFFLEGATEYQDPRCQYFLAEMLRNGEVGKINVDEAVKYYGMAAGRGYYPAQFMLAKIFENVVDNFQTTLEFYENAVKNGHVDAMLRLAYIYEKGIRLPKNFDKAVEYYKSAAEHGSAEAKLKLARIGIEPQNYGGVSSFSRSDACKMLKELSEESKVNNLIKRDALYFLGQLYEQGIEKDSPDFNAAFECFSKSSNLGSLPSMYKYGCYLFNGQGCVADKVEAFAILHIVRFISSSNVDPSVKSQELISPDQLVELTERRLVDYEEQLTEAQRSEAFKIADERLGRIFNVS